MREPPPGLPVVVPEIVLAPLLAFDARGNRLGYGAGFYDMTFAAIAAAGVRAAARRLLLRLPGGRRACRPTRPTCRSHLVITEAGAVGSPGGG